MTEDDLKLIIEAYQKKAFELFNTNIVLEVKISKLNQQLNKILLELEQLKNSKNEQIEF